MDCIFALLGISYSVGFLLWEVVFKTKGLEFLNPKYLYYKYTLFNWFGIVWLSLFINIICLPYSVTYWVYKSFTFKRNHSPRNNQYITETILRDQVKEKNEEIKQLKYHIDSYEKSCHRLIDQCYETIQETSDKSLKSCDEFAAKLKVQIDAMNSINNTSKRDIINYIDYLLKDPKNK